MACIDSVTYAQRCAHAALKEQVSALIAERESLNVLNASLAEKNEILVAKLRQHIYELSPEGSDGAFEASAHEMTNAERWRSQRSALKKQLSALIAERESLKVLNASLAEKNEILHAKLRQHIYELSPEGSDGAFEASAHEMTNAERTERWLLQHEAPADVAELPVQHEAPADVAELPVESAVEHENDDDEAEYKLMRQREAVTLRR